MSDPQPTTEPTDELLGKAGDDANVAPDAGTATPSIPTWVAITIFVALLALAAGAGYAAHAGLNARDRARLKQLDAIQSARRAVAKTPEDARATLALASAYRDAGQKQAALAEYEAILKKRPHDVAALYGRAELLRDLGRSDDAESAFWAVLAEDPGHVQAAQALGEYYASKRQYRSLVKAVRPAVTQHPTEAQLQYLMGVAYEQLGRKDWASARYQLALDAVPDMPEALAGLKRLNE